MNVALHALAGGALAHLAFLSGARASKPGALRLSLTALASVASHGVLDWLRHGYPIPSRLDVVLALALSGAWLLKIQPQLRPLLAVALAGSILPDVVDHLPRLMHFSSALPHPLFPWHSRTWSGSLYPVAHIRPGSHLVAIEHGHNAQASLFNHLLVVVTSLCSIVAGRAAFGRTDRPGHV